jgi:hypothetical protein
MTKSQSGGVSKSFPIVEMEPVSISFVKSAKETS